MKVMVEANNRSERMSFQSTRGIVSICSLICLILLGFISTFELYLDFNISWYGYILGVLTFFLISLNYKEKKAIGLIFVLIGAILYTVPYYFEISTGNRIPIVFFFLFLCFHYYIIRFYRIPWTEDRKITVKSSCWKWTIFFLVCSCVGLFTWDYLFLACYGIALYHYDSLCRGSNVNKRIIWLIFILFISVVLVYMIYVWSGFGRILVFSYMLLPVLILVHNQYLVVKGQMLILVLPPALMASGWLRGMQEFELSAIAGRSVSHHLVLMKDFLAGGYTLTNQVGLLFEQFLLMFANWFPRAVWPSKPVGAGHSVVDMYLGRAGFSEGYSVSLGFWGEHILWMPSLWIISSIATFVLAMLVMRAVLILSKGNFAAYSCCLVSLISLFWGGMASYGSRVWFLVLPIIFYTGVVRFTQRYKW